ncbi:MOSC domain-containing protein [Rubrivivax sp. A210]|uniref:MOSC domain-containing protein n=1 Tax=Rubrivivax sp. A210 TaxID=2772301 RepID=UPI00191A958E|nr:MOSC domain-containing protein [Rubrivivax sp. A210]CAD5373470.1 MOSC domain-containing protein [Rubrivivax sp. A210]
MKILQVCIGAARSRLMAGHAVLTAIAKSPVAGPVAVYPLGLAGDEQADLTVHGGLAKAVYAYPSEHLPFWQTVRAQAGAAAWDAPPPPGLLGENLLLQGLLEQDLWIGDRLVLPGCVLAVSEPRLPCNKFAAAMGFAQAVKLMAQSGFSGAYLAVLEPGTLSAGDAIRLEPGPREVNLRELFRARAPAGTAAR